MQPRPDDRGEPRGSVEVELDGDTKLQCSHGLMTVENGREWHCHVKLHCRLQCSHGLMTVENQDGATTFEIRGRMLQCSHGLMTVENSGWRGFDA